MKSCKVCGQIKPTESFYPRSRMCRDCTCERVRANRLTNAEYYRNYDATRRDRPRSVPKLGAAAARSAKYYEANREKVAARDKVQKSLRSGALVRPNSCSRCAATSDQIEAHHTDYSKPLAVTWLCDACHSKEHTKRDVSRFKPRKSRWLSTQPEREAP